MKALLIGMGTIANDIRSLLEGRPVEVCGAVVHRDTDRESDIPIFGQDRLEEAAEGADVIVECAGGAAVRAYAPRIAAIGKPFVLTSVGALADQQTAEVLLGMPNLVVTNGAIGGFDVLRSAALLGFDRVSITTTKKASTLVQDWMDDDERTRLEQLPAGQTAQVFDGGPEEAIAKFPSNLNVATALAWATAERDLPDGRVSPESLRASLARVRVELIGNGSDDPTFHDIEASGAAGDFTFRISSAPSPHNPSTSALTAISIVGDLLELAGS